MNRLDARGTVIADELVRATAGSGTRGTFAIDITYPRAHSGHGTVMAFDISEKDGSKIDVVKVPVTLR